MKEKGFLGQGWAFPPSFDIHGGTVEMVSNELDIQQSLIILLTTQLGERLMHPDYGSRISELVFEKFSTSRVTFLKDMIETAILYHEPRIKLIRIDAHSNVSDGVIDLDILYEIRSTNTRTNLVFPFYFDEGTDRIVNR